ncbi:hypothetical protein H920_03483 [Fukomys damarensis]|uniref:Uncharacterized protein n=1 Tax=Fukomys damarensis TaxID=885580 RepID=A0A091DXQ8_FUKDA|nr:hypothetical protein H920_03483 [Fukomys damarensis]
MPVVRILRILSNQFSELQGMVSNFACCTCWREAPRAVCPSVVTAHDVIQLLMTLRITGASFTLAEALAFLLSTSWETRGAHDHAYGVVHSGHTDLCVDNCDLFTIFQTLYHAFIFIMGPLQPDGRFHLLRTKFFLLPHQVPKRR